MTIRLPRRIYDLAGLALLSLVGAAALGGVALNRGEHVNAAWILLATVCWFVLGYRVYSRFIADRVLGLDDGRATPAEVNDDGRDYVPTHRMVVFGHHFAAIAGPGPLVGPVLAAQLGYLPGLVWLLVGSVLGGCVQDFVVLFCSMRRNGKSLGQIAREELGVVGGFTALVGVLAIMVILLAVIGLVVVKALADSPWGTFTIAATIPIALLMGVYMRFWRPGRVDEASLVGGVLVLASVWAGGLVAHSPTLAPWFTFDAKTMALLLIAYGYAASTLPVWLLLAPRDYLSTFVKIGTVGLLGVGILAARPDMALPPVTPFFYTGMGPVWAGSPFPFLFVTIACGAVSGFHALIASGTTPKLIRKESQARLIGYGAMLTEAFVAVMALLAASVLSPGVYFAMNSPTALVGSTPAAAVATISGWGFPLTELDMQSITQAVGEKTLFARTGGAPTLAVGMARIFGSLTGGRALDLWYHFAIMFEALFILTTLDAGTRVGRFMLQDLLGHAWEPLGRVSWGPGVLVTSAMMVGAWGWFLLQGVMDPLGGINSLWPLFGISNQMLAAIALCVATTVLLKMGRGRYAWVTGVPLAWLAVTTLTAAWEKITAANPRVGFLADAAQLRLRQAGVDPTEAARLDRLIFNDRLDAGMAVFLASVVVVILCAAVVTWWRIATGRVEAVPSEAPYVPSRFSA